MQRGRKEECDVEETSGERIESIIFSKKCEASILGDQDNGKLLFMVKSILLIT